MFTEKQEKLETRLKELRDFTYQTKTVSPYFMEKQDKVELSVFGNKVPKIIYTETNYKIPTSERI